MEAAVIVLEGKCARKRPSEDGIAVTRELQEARAHPRQRFLYIIGPACGRTHLLLVGWQGSLQGGNLTHELQRGQWMYDELLYFFLLLLLLRTATLCTTALNAAIAIAYAFDRTDKSSMCGCTEEGQ
jgi:hypothetical protein